MTHLLNPRPQSHPHNLKHRVQENFNKFNLNPVTLEINPRHLYTGNSLMSTFTVKSQMKCSIMLYFIGPYPVYKG